MFSAENQFDEIQELAAQLDINLSDVPLVMYNDVPNFLTLLQTEHVSLQQYRNYQPPSFTIPSSSEVQAVANEYRY